MSHFDNITSYFQSVRWRMAGAIIVLFLLLTASFEQMIIAQSSDSATSRSEQKGRKFVNKIPFDVFFDNPLQVVNSNKTVVAPMDKSSDTPSQPKPTSEVAKTPAKTGGIAWEELIPMEELHGEVKTIRNSLTKSMANQKQFNDNFKSIAVDGAELAALAGIVQQSSEPLSWKDKSQFVRDFSAQLNQSSVGLGKENFEKTKSAFQKLSSVLDGSIPADAGQIPDVRPFHEVAARKGLMKRIEKAKDWLKQDVNSEAKFKSMADQIRHESAILSALGTIITTTGYDYTENDDYQQFARLLIGGAKEALDASKDQSYDKFKQAIDKVNKSCTDCHGSYGNG